MSPARVVLLFLIAGCASTSVRPLPPTPRPPPAKESPALSEEGTSPSVVEGELPWWREIPPGVYRYRGERVVLAVGTSEEHQHLAESYLDAKISARLKVREAASVAQFPKKMSELGLDGLIKAIKGQPVDKSIDTGAALVTKANMDNFK